MSAAPDAPDQREVIDFLGRPQAYGGRAEAVERIDTHGAVVFLAGSRAYKLKRAVHFPYMDYSTVERRRAMCEAELAVNRRTAPTLYEAVAPIVRAADGHLRIGGAGAVVDWLVVMRRFDQAGLFDRLAAAGRLTPALMAELATVVAAFHRDAARCPQFGGAEGMAWVIDGNRAGLLDAESGTFAPDLVRDVDAPARAQLAALRGLLDRRRDDGFVRRCHGDLHLRNICLIDGRPVPFDAIEFNDRIACIDTLYDLAFLLMDLESRDLRDLANAAFNAYLDASADHGGLAALPLFLACRAGVKAQTGAASARAQPDPDKRKALIAEAQASLGLARSFLVPARARLIAIGGLSGTGKSTIARMLAPYLGRAPGAAVLRTDVIRKRLAGVAPTVRLGAEAYTREAAARVYAAMTETARQIAVAGQVVIADAVFADAAERAAIEAAARAVQIPFTGIWLDAPPDLLAARIAARHGDASDATTEVLHRQLSYDLGTIGWYRADAAGGPEATAAAVRRLI